MRHRLEADAAKASSPPCGSYTPSSLSAPARSWGCFRRSDGPFRHTQCHAVLCLGQRGSGAAVSPGVMVLELVALATGQRRRGVLRLVRAQTLIAQLAKGEARYLGRLHSLPDL